MSTVAQNTPGVDISAFMSFCFLYAQGHEKHFGHKCVAPIDTVANFALKMMQG